MKTPTTVLLVVIAALLAANLFVNLSPQVGASPPRTALSGDDDDEAVLVGITVIHAGNSSSHKHVLRLWSDGVVEQRFATGVGATTPLTWFPDTQWSEIDSP